MPKQVSYGESSEVNWELDPTTGYGTLVRPSGPGPFPAVVMVAGSGPTDRDWNSPSFAGHEEVTFLFPENANHVLKQELRPRLELVPAEIVESYNGPDTRLDPQALASILAWLAAHA